MKKGYLLALIDVKNAGVFKEYTSRTPQVLQDFGGRFIIRGPEPEVLEGGSAKRRVVVVEFDSSEIARQFYESEGYQFAAEFRRASAECDLFLLEGYEGVNEL